MEGWRARAGDLASKTFQNPSKIFQNPFFKIIFLQNLRKSTRSLLGPAPAGSAQLRPARPGSFLSRASKNSFLGPVKCENFLLVGWMVSKSLIARRFYFFSVLNSPPPNEGFKSRGSKGTKNRPKTVPSPDGCGISKRVLQNSGTTW